MKLKLQWIFTLLVVLSVQFSFAQERVVTGIVSGKTGVIPGVNVAIKGTKKGTTTDFDGGFSVKVNTGDVLVFSYVGMDDASVTVGASSKIQVNMVDSGKTLDEVVVVAYGRAKKSSYTGSAVQIKAEQLENRPLTNALSVIEGTSSGVQIQSAAGQPGSAPSIRIRGFSSVNLGNSPLYVVDGVPFSGDISNLNANDIESLTVLKDASSTSLYGSKAANGVVIITTKIGKSSKDKFTLNVSQGLTSRLIKEYDRVGALDYYPLEWEAIRNSRP
ncbi:MAG: TonB-dependent receptor plug domain-containing protein, partial [Flavobacterium sp.]